MHVELSLTNFGSLALDKLIFTTPLLAHPRVSYRGRALSNAFYSNSFQWTSAVQALTVLLLITKAETALSHFPGSPQRQDILSGAAGSLAASLDYALSKRPLWLLDMFGVDASGTSLTRRLFVRWNPERKRGGSVIVAVNLHHIPAQAITVNLNGSPVTCKSTCREIADTIKADFLASQIRNRSAVPKMNNKEEGVLAEQRV